MRYFLLCLIFFSCTEIVYKHESNIDYEIYQTVYVEMSVSSDYFYYPERYNYEGHLIEYFINRLAEKSDFRLITTDYSKRDSMDCRLDISIVNVSEKARTREGIEEIEVEAKIRAVLYDSGNVRVFETTKSEDKDEEFSSDYTYIEKNEEADDLKYKVMKEVLSKISSEFLRNLEI